MGFVPISVEKSRKISKNASPNLPKNYKTDPSVFGEKNRILGIYLHKKNVYHIFKMRYTLYISSYYWIGRTTHCFSLRSKDVREGFFWREVVFFDKNFQFLLKKTTSLR